MAIPSAPTGITVASTGDGQMALISWVQASDDEVGFQVERSDDDGSTWVFSREVGKEMTQVSDLLPLAESTNYKYRVRAYNGDGDSAWNTSTTHTTTIDAAEDSEESHFYLLIGDLMQGNRTPTSNFNTSSRGVSGGAAVSASPYPVGEFNQGQRFWWDKRNSPFAWPGTTINRPAFIWNHVGGRLPIASVALNSPGAGETELTLTIQGNNIGRTIGRTLTIEVEDTGIDGLDGEWAATVTAATKVKLPFLAGGTSLTGTLPIIKLPRSIKSARTNGHTDETYAGGFDLGETVWCGPDRTLIPLVQDAGQAGGHRAFFIKLAANKTLRGQRFDWRGQETWNRDHSGVKPKIAVSAIATGNPTVITLASDHGVDGGSKFLIDIAGVTGNTPSINGSHQASFSGTDQVSIEVNTTVGGSGGTVAIPFSVYDRLSKLLSDVHQWVSDPLFSGLLSSTFLFKGIAIHHGNAEAFTGDSAVARTTGLISSIVIAADVVTINTVAALSTVEPTVAPDSRRVVKFGTVTGGTIALTGKILSVTIVSTTSFTLDHVDGTAQTAGTGTSFEIGDPLHFFSEDLTNHIDDVRQLCVDTFSTGQDIDTIPVAVIRSRPEISNMPASGYKNTEVGLIRDGQEDAATLPGVGVIDTDRYDHAIGGVFPTYLIPHDLDWDIRSQFKLGEDINAAWIDPSLFGVGGDKTPAVVVGYMGHSMGTSLSKDAFTEDDDPDYLSTVALPIPRVKIWDHTLAAFVDLLLDTTGCNANTHPVWNPTNGDAVTLHPSLLRGLTERFPDETVYLIALAEESSSVAPHSITQTGLSNVITSMVLNASTIQFTTLRNLTSTNTFTVDISGVSGVTGFTNGQYTATPDTLGPTGVLTFTIAVLFQIQR